MKCARPSCRAPMLLVGHGSYQCSVEECGSTTVLTDMAIGAGLTASSKPSSAEERSTKSRIQHERGQATRRRIIVLSAEGFSSEAIATAISLGVRGGVQYEPVSAEYVGQVVREAVV